MNQLRNNKIFRLLRRLIKSPNKRVVIYLVCVGIATIFWLLNMLGKEYTTDLELRVKYGNLPKNKVLVNELPKKITLHVNAYGFTLLRHKLNLSFSPLLFNITDITRNAMESGKRTGYIVLANQYISEISSQLSSDVKVLGIKPDTIRFSLDKIIQKKVKVYPNVNIEVKQQYQVSGQMRIKPDSVLVSGPRFMVDTLKRVFTEYRHYKFVSKLIQEKVRLATINDIEFAQNQVQLTVPVEEYTESQMLIPIFVENAPDSIHLKLFPNRVKATFIVGLGSYSEITPSNFRMVVSWNDRKPEGSMLKVQIRKVSPFVKSVKITPEEVEYLIER